jgi:heparosan-N-sulfate-glucuronate 5-epimerase
MCQDQAISVLVRAFLTSGNQEYLAAAERAVGVVNVTSVEGGVRAVFMEKHVWYEAYPTNPPTFILNGFRYSQDCQERFCC